MDPRGCYSNSALQVSELEALLGQLPDLEIPYVQASKRRVPGTARRLDPDQVQELVAGYRAGRTVYDLAGQFKISRQTVSAILGRAGVTTRYRRLTPEQIEEAVRLYGDGWSLAQIGGKLNVTAKTVQKWLRERGVRMRDIHGQARRG